MLSTHAFARNLPDVAGGSMTRVKSSGDLGTRTDRANLPARKEPSWLVLEKGRALGYAKGAKCGTWIACY